MAEEGLRERKKRQTRVAIAEAARRLFRERGFAGVTVAEVAKAADVSHQTVFNYFPTKEDLFFSGMQAFETELVDAVRRRAPGESALSAFRRALLGRSARLADPRAGDAIASAARMIGATRSLQNRERAVLEEHTRALAAALAEEDGSDEARTEALAVANALMGVHAALLERIRVLALAGVRGAELRDVFEMEGVRAFDRLERGLAGYAVAREARSSGGSRAPARATPREASASARRRGR